MFPNIEAVRTAQEKYGPSNISVRLDLSTVGKTRVRVYWHTHEAGMRKIKIVDVVQPLEGEA